MGTRSVTSNSTKGQSTVDRSEEDMKVPSYAELQKMAEKAPKRNLQGSLDQMKEELRDAYMNFMEMQEKCVLDIQSMKSADHQVYYFRPDTFLLDDPNKQANFRESLLRKISSMPKPEPITYLGDEMHRAYCATIADQSHPTVAKKNLALYFKRR